MFLCICEWVRSRSGVRKARKKEIERRRKEGRRERESKCAALRRSIIYQTPAASLFPPPHPPPPSPPAGERVRERGSNRERERERESHAYKPAEKRRQEEDLQRGGEKSFPLFCCLSPCILRQQGARRIRLAYFLRCFPAISEAV